MYRKKPYYLANRDYLLEYQRLYRLDNLEKVKQYEQEYKTKHKEERKLSVSCSCGGSYTYHHKSAHFKTKRHLENEATLAKPCNL
jgi:hypothetical protein